MNLRNVLLPLAAVGLPGFGFAAYGWAGVLAVVGAMVMWGLLHFTRLVAVMKKTARRPMGYVGSAVMLNARLRKGVNMMHVLALTQALGEMLSAADAQPEVYRWTDASQSHVTCEFRHGKLVSWVLFRPQDGNASANPPPAAP
ncbi:glycerate kinase [Verminephrobacter eiseniae]|uniref:glycerate kinase n=1 Tax=Verminephrobacter eiseniae TaxID=364317 RepID=UPI002238144B|nr:glycerate kinase [Verminephrobacter eiseniae]MCW5237259.1 glycerate kinase [Verminephrobacter eiseniae]